MGPAGQGAQPGDPYGALAQPVSRAPEEWRQPASVIRLVKAALVFLIATCVNGVITLLGAFLAGAPETLVGGLLGVGGGIMFYAIARAIEKRSSGARIAMLILSPLSLVTFLFAFWGFAVAMRLAAYLDLTAVAILVVTFLSALFGAITQVVILVSTASADTGGWCRT